MPTYRKNGVVLISSDLCPKGNCGAVQGHLVSDHNAQQGQCSKCACVIQSVDNHIGRHASKTGA